MSYSRSKTNVIPDSRNIKLGKVIMIVTKIFLVSIVHIITAEFLITIENTEDVFKSEIIAEVAEHNLKNNGWSNIYFLGNSPETLYSRLITLPYTVTVSSIGEEDQYIEDVIPYHSNIIVLSCLDFEEFEGVIRKAIVSPYWHPLANVILNYHTPLEKGRIAKIFFVLLYYRVVNVVIIHRESESVLISHYSHYITEHYKLKENFGCWTSSKVFARIEQFEKSFECVQGCQNVSLHSFLRAEHLGTCIGFDTKVIKNKTQIKQFNFFEDKTKDMHGYTMRAYSVEVLPFLEIRSHDNESFTLHSRDGMLWNTMAELFNFKIDLSPGRDIMKGKFNFEKNIIQMFDFLRRKGDLLLFPLYQFDIIVVELDYTVPFMESGLCILSQRADYETIVFNIKLLESNLDSVIRFTVCFLCTWLVFLLFNMEQFGKVTFDQAGKDLINTFKIVLSLSLYRYPRKTSFHIFFFIAIWSFFVLNFSTQAAIISLFSVYKRGSEVDSFEDVIEKGYKIEGMSSPDIILPNTEEKFRKINSKLEPIQDLFGCVQYMANDSERFCVIDCALGRYLERNMLNDKGKQFLHIAKKDRIHSYYLNMIFHKYSPLTDRYNKYIMMLFEAGLIMKWMDYRFTVIREEVPLKALGMDDMEGIFKCFTILLLICCFVFILELLVAFLYYVKLKIKSRRRTLNFKYIFKSKFQRTQKYIKHSDASTQTLKKPSS